MAESMPQSNTDVGPQTTRDLDKEWRVQKYILANKSASALREVVHTSSEANIGATRN